VASDLSQWVSKENISQWPLLTAIQLMNEWVIKEIKERNKINNQQTEMVEIGEVEIKLKIEQACGCWPGSVAPSRRWLIIATCLIIEEGEGEGEGETMTTNRADKNIHVLLICVYISWRCIACPHWESCMLVCGTWMVSLHKSQRTHNHSLIQFWMFTGRRERMEGVMNPTNCIFILQRN
jgi:hypothetical protein